jgi:hypothetical protein
MTAVEWLEEELKANLKKVILEGDSELMESLFDQAKEMEKEQIEKLWTNEEVFDMLYKTDKFLMIELREYWKTIEK